MTLTPDEKTVLLIAAQAEQIAVQLVDLAEASSKATGDDKVEALRQWARVILERALEIMR